MKAKDAMEFVSACIGQAEADGYQQFEESGNVIPDGKTPDDVYATRPAQLVLVFGEQRFALTMREIKEKKS